MLLSNGSVRITVHCYRALLKIKRKKKEKKQKEETIFIENRPFTMRIVNGTA